MPTPAPTLRIPSDYERDVQSHSHAWPTLASDSGATTQHNSAVAFVCPLSRQHRSFGNQEITLESNFILVNAVIFASVSFLASVDSTLHSTYQEQNRRCPALSQVKQP